MNFINEINNTKTDEEIKKLIDKKIEEETKKSLLLNEHHIIGANTDINPKFTIYNSENKYEYNGYYLGYIPKNTKIVYCTITNIDTCLQYNAGLYYYLNDVTYLYSFAKFIKNKIVEDELDFMGYVYAFLRLYFENSIDNKKREDIHQLIYQNNDFLYPPIKEHSNKDFIHNGSALCSEYSASACNIFNIFDIDAYYLQDSEHAYNIVAIKNGNYKDYYLFDSTLKVNSYNIINSEFEQEAFIEELGFDDDDFYNFLINKETIRLNDYYLIYYKDKYLRIYLDRYRDYGIESDYYVKIENNQLIFCHKK